MTRPARRTQKNGAFCLGTQIEADCVRRGVGLVEAGEEYISTTLYSVEIV